MENLVNGTVTGLIVFLILAFLTLGTYLIKKGKFFKKQVERKRKKNAFVNWCSLTWIDIKTFFGREWMKKFLLTTLFLGLLAIGWLVAINWLTAILQKWGWGPIEVSGAIIVLTAIFMFVLLWSVWKSFAEKLLWDHYTVVGMFLLVVACVIGLQAYHLLGRPTQYFNTATGAANFVVEPNDEIRLKGPRQFSRLTGATLPDITAEEAMKLDTVKKKKPKTPTPTPAKKEKIKPISTTGEWLLLQTDPIGQKNPWPTKAWIEISGDLLIYKYLAGVNPNRYGIGKGRRKPGERSYIGTWDDYKAQGDFECFFTNTKTIYGWHRYKGEETKLSFVITKK